MPRIGRGAPQREDSDDEIQHSTEHIASGQVSDAELDAELQHDSEQREQLARKLVRYALSCEFSRQPIRRADITAKIPGTASKQFRPIFAEAQIMLKHTFGMELLELPKAEKVTVQQKRAAQKNDKTASASSNAWILVSTLPTKYRTAEILTPAPAPTVEQESTYVGLYSFIVSIIYLSGGTLPESKLERYLRRGNANENTPIDRTEKVLQKMVKDGYIVKVKDNSTGEEIVDYIVGPRGKVEIGTDGVGQLARMVFGEEDQDDLTERLNRTFALVQKQEEQPPPQPKPRGKPKRQRTEQTEDGDDDDGEELEDD